MAVSRRLRFEVLRRDRHQCRYCGGAAPAVELTVDHVIPVALGGSDQPDNLVAACRPCNAGKSSSGADAPPLPDIRDDAIRWAQAMQAAGEDLLEGISAKQDYLDEFEQKWKTWHYKGTSQCIPLPDDWRRSLDRWRRLGVPVAVLADAVDDAMGYRTYRGEDDQEFRFMAGIVWKYVDEMHLRAMEKLKMMPDGPYTLPEAYDAGWKDGQKYGITEGQEWITPSVKQAMHTYVHLSKVVDGDLKAQGVYL